MFPLLKRTTDTLAALTGLLLLSPILLITTIVLRLTGEYKVLFTQTRVGHKNKPFKIYKFTTMLSTPPDMKGKTITGKRDPRITPIGAFLRNSKIDEFPQLFNVLIGDMSFVGPRPLMKEPDFISYPPEVQEVIYNVRPGITAIGSVVFRDEAALISQVQEEGGDAGEFKQKVIFPYKGQLEVWYNKNQSFWVDLKILFLTAWTLIFSTSQLAYKAFDGLPQRSAALNVEFDRMLQLRESITLLLVVIFVLVPIIPSPFWFWNNPQFVLMALIPVLWFAYMQYRKDEIPIKAIPSDIGWLAFIGIGFLSYGWAINGSLIWYQTFGWLSLILWMLLFRSLSARKTAQAVMPTLFLFFFLAMLFHHFLALFGNVETDQHWNYFFGKNANYTSCFLVSLYPYVLFFRSKHKVLTLVKILATFGVLYILYITKTKWALIAFLVIGLYYLWHYATKKIFLGVLGMIALGIGYFNLPTNLNGVDISSVPLLRQFAGTSEAFKLYLAQSSLQIFTENPVVGVGAGNWQLVAYKLGVNDILDFNDPTTFVRFRSHNLYLRHLVELGLLGLLAFIIPILSTLRMGWAAEHKKNDFQKAAYASLLVYLITAAFYNDVNFYEYHFSGLQLLAFCALGILTSQAAQFYKLPNWANYVFLAISILALTWFAYTKYSYDQYWIAKHAMRKNEQALAIRQFEKVYHPVFKTANGFQERLSYNKLIALDLAQLYQQKGDLNKAEHYYNLALQQAPYHEQALLYYAQFNLRDQKNVEKAKEYAGRIANIQENSYDLKLLLAEIAIAENKFEVAEQYLRIFEGEISKSHQSLAKKLKLQLSEKAK